MLTLLAKTAVALCHSTLHLHTAKTHYCCYIAATKLAIVSEELRAPHVSAEGGSRPFRCPSGMLRPFERFVEDMLKTIADAGTE